MATESLTKCDVCALAKGETNHWHRIREDANSFRILKPHVKKRAGDKDVCGQAHLHTLVDRYLEGEMKVIPVDVASVGEIVDTGAATASAL